MKPKSDITKSFIGEILEHEHVKGILENYTSGNLQVAKEEHARLCKLTFVGENSGNAYISQISRKFDISASILFGNIEIIQNQSVGILIVQIAGSKENIENAVTYLKEKQIIVQEVA